MKTRILLFISIVLITFLACSKQGEPPKPEEPPTVDDYYIFLNNGTDTFHFRTKEKVLGYSFDVYPAFRQYIYEMWFSTPDNSLSASATMIFADTLKMDQINKHSVLIRMWVMQEEGYFQEFAQGNVEIDELIAIDSIKVWKQAQSDTFFVDGHRIRGHGELPSLSNRNGVNVESQVNVNISLPFPSFVNLPE